MGLFSKRKKPNKSEYANQEESRVPNHWSFNDDPLLNIEPEFSDSVKPKEKENDFSVSEVNDNKDASTKLDEIKKRISINKPLNNSPLGSIISGARKKTNDLQKEVIEKDPVIAKLQKIEELKRTGGVDANLYTDLSKSDSTKTYAKRAQEFHEKNFTKHIQENEIQRKMRLFKEAEEKRKAGIKENKTIWKTNELFKKSESKREELLKSAKPKSKTILNLEEKIKKELENFKEINIHIAENNVENLIAEIENKTFKTNKERESYLSDKLKDIESLVADLKKEKGTKKIDISKNILVRGAEKTKKTSQAGAKKIIIKK